MRRDVRDKSLIGAYQLPVMAASATAERSASFLKTRHHRVFRDPDARCDRPVLADGTGVAFVVEKPT